MKGMDIFCASPASTAICSSVDHRSMVRSGHHRHRNPKLPYAPCSSQLPIIPSPYNYHHQYDEKRRKSTSSSKPSDLRRKSSADITDLKRSTSPAGNSSRYLLSGDRDRPFIEWLPSSESSDKHNSSSALVPYDHPSPKPRRVSSTNGRYSSAKVLVRSQSEKPTSHDQLPSSNDVSSPALKSSSTNRKSDDQVVVLRVSIHCKGCEGKVRKHISKMEGVRGFSIDLAAKKVTVVGKVTPQGVLQSVSRVKKAQFWPSTVPTSSSPTPTPVLSMITY